MIYNKEYFKDKVLVIRTNEQLDKILSDFNCDKSDVKVKEFPMIVYGGRFESIEICEISIGNLSQLKCDPDFNRTIEEFK